MEELERKLGETLNYVKERQENVKELQDYVKELQQKQDQLMGALTRAASP